MKHITPYIDYIKRFDSRSTNDIKNNKNIYKFISYNDAYYEIDEINYIIEQVIDDYRYSNDIRYFDFPSIYEYSSSIRPMNQEELDIFAETNSMYITNDNNYTYDINKSKDNVENISIRWREMPETWIKPDDNIMNTVDDVLREQYRYIYNKYFIDTEEYYDDDDDEIEWHTPDEWFNY